MMRYRLLGRSGLRVSELAYGAMNFGTHAWGTPDADACAALYHAYREAGGNFIDTANEIYADGRSEQFLGKLMAGHRDEVVVGSKYSFHLPGSANANIAGNHRKSMMRSVEGSLARLGTDFIDVLWVHGWDTLTPVDEMMRGLDDLVRQGKVQYIGISNAPAWLVAHANTMAELHGWSRFVGLQVEYNLVERDVEHELLPMARALGLGVLAWSPLASGILSGKYNRDAGEDSRRLDVNTFMATADERALKIAGAVAELASELQRPATQVALNWLRAQPDVVPIIGARTLGQLEENLGCLDFRLTPEQVAGLNEASRRRTPYPHNFIERTRFISSGGFSDKIDG
jgi:aryl-alcohol dehydrogenase-like predicted oxidoreductase